MKDCCQIKNSAKNWKRNCGQNTLNPVLALKLTLRSSLGYVAVDLAAQDCINYKKDILIIFMVRNLKEIENKDEPFFFTSFAIVASGSYGSIK